jgi:hypothetical protein
MATMGQLMYGTPADSFDLDDRTLAHVEIVIIAKLRRAESFAFSLPGKGDARTSIWISPSSDLQFEYGNGSQEVNRGWLEALIESANSPQGLRIADEPDSKAAAAST